MYEVRRFRTSNNQEPVTDWERGLRDARARGAIDRRIVRLADGNFGDHKFCRDGVWELRVDVGAGYRVYYGLAGRQLVMLLCGGDKGSQSADIDRACRYWREWQRSESNERQK